MKGKERGRVWAPFDNYLSLADPLQMRASSMGINYEAMTAKAAEMLAESQSKAGAGVKVSAGDVEDVKPAKSVAAGEARTAVLT